MLTLNIFHKYLPTGLSHVSKRFWTNCTSLNKNCTNNTRKGNVNCFSIFYFCYEFENKFVLTVNKTLPQCNVKVIFQSKNYLSNSLKFKDSISVYLRSHLIYKFQCNNCNTRFFYKQSQTEIGKK